uniref:Uncharacterized protein n=1 Tax=Anolis carolinensis TaxID=28377 RepID=A0A803T1V2_ANOCA
METSLLNLQNLFDHLMHQVEILNEGIEYQFIHLTKNFEEFRGKSARKWIMSWPDTKIF